MNIEIFGSTGQSGRAILYEALERGHGVTAFVRNGESLDVEAPNLKVVEGDVLDIESVKESMIGHSAVIAALGGGTSLKALVKRNTIRTEGNRNIVQAMEELGVQRLISQSVFGIDPEGHKKLPFIWKALVKPVILKQAYRDHRGQEEIIMSSDLDWTIIRPTSLRDLPKGGDFQHGDPSGMTDIKLNIGLKDLAAFYLDCLEDDSTIGTTPGITN